MKRVISIIATVAMVMSLFTGMAFANQGNGNGHNNGNGQNIMEQEDDSKGTVFGNGNNKFKDMNNHWGSDAVENMQSSGILEGYADGTFLPDKAITEAELAVILQRVLELVQDDDSEDDSDLEDDLDDDDDRLSNVPDWADDAVSNGFHHKYFNEKRFHSEQQCNRLYACVAIAKALDLDPITDFDENPFGDRGLMSDEDYGYILALYEEGYISGYPDGNFNPNFMISRAQIATIIYKLLVNEGLLDDEISNDETAPDWDSNSEITASAIAATSVKLSWSAADDDVAVVGYKIMYEIDSVDKTKYVTGRTATITGLDKDTEYTFTVEAKDAAGNLSNDGPSVDVTTLEEDIADETAPDWNSDSTITASAITADGVKLSWTAADDNVAVVAYKVMYQIDGIDKTKYVTGRTATITGLVPETEYTFTVEAKDAVGNLSDDGPSVDVTTLAETVADTTAPVWATGSIITADTTVSGSVTLIWPDAEDTTGVEKYKVYKDGVLVITLDGNANSYTVTGLTVDREYIFKVRAIDAAGNLSTNLSVTYLAE